MCVSEWPGHEWLEPNWLRIHRERVVARRRPPAVGAVPRADHLDGDAAVRALLCGLPDDAKGAPADDIVELEGPVGDLDAVLAPTLREGSFLQQSIWGSGRQRGVMCGIPAWLGPIEPDDLRGSAAASFVLAMQSLVLGLGRPNRLEQFRRENCCRNRQPVT